MHLVAQHFQWMIVHVNETPAKIIATAKPIGLDVCHLISIQLDNMLVGRAD